MRVEPASVAGSWTFCTRPPDANTAVSAGLVSEPVTERMRIPGGVFVIVPEPAAERDRLTARDANQRATAPLPCGRGIQGPSPEKYQGD